MLEALSGLNSDSSSFLNKSANLLKTMSGPLGNNEIVSEDKQEENNSPVFCGSSATSDAKNDVKPEEETCDNSGNQPEATGFLKKLPNKQFKANAQKTKSFDAVKHKVLNDNRGIGCDIVPEYLRTNKFETHHQNIKNMEVILSSEATMEYNDEDNNFQSSLKCQLVGLQPKGLRMQRITPGPPKVLRDEVIYLPYNSKYRRATMNVEIKPNSDATNVPVPIKVIKDNSFYSKYSRINSSRRAEVPLQTQTWYSRSSRSPIGSHYYANSYNTRSRSHTRMYESPAFGETLAGTRHLRNHYGSMNSLTELNQRRNDFRPWGGYHCYHSFISPQRGIPYTIVREGKQSNTLVKTTTETTTTETSVEKLNPAPNTIAITKPEKQVSLMKITETAPEKKISQPVDNRWNTTTTETISEMRTPAPVDNRWNTTTTETISEMRNPAPVDNRWNTTTTETISETRNPAPVNKRWNTTTETTIHKVSTPPVDNRWKTTTTETVTEKRDIKRDIAPLDKSWNATNKETVVEKSKLSPVNNTWKTTTTETVTEKKYLAPVSNRWNTTTSETVSEKRNIAPVNNRWNTSTEETVIEKRNLELPENRRSKSITETVVDTRGSDTVDNQLKGNNNRSLGRESFTTVTEYASEVKSEQDNKIKKAKNQLDVVAVCNFESKHGFTLPSSTSNCKTRSGFTMDINHMKLSYFNCTPINIIGEPKVSDNHAKRKTSFKSSETWFRFEEVQPKTATLHLVDVDSSREKETNKVFLDLPDRGHNFPVIHKASSFPELFDGNNNFPKSDRSMSTGNIKLSENLGAKTASTDSITYVFVSRARSLNSMTLDRDSRRRRLLRPKSEPCCDSNDFESDDDDEYFFAEPKETYERRMQNSGSLDNIYWYEIGREDPTSDSDTDESLIENYGKPKSKPQSIKIVQPVKISEQKRVKRIPPESNIIITSPRGSTFAADASYEFLPKVNLQQNSAETSAQHNDDASNFADVHVIIDKVKGGKHLKISSEAEEELIKSVVTAYLADLDNAKLDSHNHRKEPRDPKQATKGIRKQAPRRNIKIIFRDPTDAQSPKDTDGTRFLFRQKSSAKASNSPLAQNEEEKTFTVKDKSGSQRVFIISHQWDKDQGVMKIFLKEHNAVPLTQQARKFSEPFVERSLNSQADGKNVFEIHNYRNTYDILLPVPDKDKVHKETISSANLQVENNNYLDNEIEKLRRERQEILGLLSKDHRSSQFQVELAEAELNYINGQTDTLLNGIDKQAPISKIKQYEKRKASADEIELLLDLTKKNYLHRWKSERDLDDHEVNAGKTGKRLSVDGSKKSVKQTTRRVSIHSADFANLASTSSHENVTHDCPFSHVTACKWSSPKLTGRCTYCESASGSVNQLEAGRAHHFHSACKCTWKKNWPVRGREVKSVAQQCPLCSYQKQMSLSCVDLSGAKNTNFHFQQNHKPRLEDQSLLLSNWKLNHPKRHPFSKSKKHLQTMNTQLTNDGPRERSSSSSSSQRSTLISPHMHKMLNHLSEPRYEDLSQASSYDSAVFMEPAFHRGFASPKIPVI